MSYRLVFQAEATVDLQETFEWYEKQNPGLGYRLLEEIEIGLSKLSEHPQHYTFLDGRYRRFKINRFPFLLIYEIEEDVVIVNSVFYAKRKPKY